MTWWQSYFGREYSSLLLNIYNGYIYIEETGSAG